MKELDTLERILILIDNDTKLVESTFNGVQLDPHTALTLTRYASTLASIKESKQKDFDKSKKSLSKLSTDDLIGLYKQSSMKEQI